MAKTVDVDLRIRAKNLTKAPLGDIIADVEKLEAAQRKQKNASDLAARSTKDLVAEQTALAQATKELTRRNNMAQQYTQQRAEVARLSTELQRLVKVSKEMQSGGSLFSAADQKRTNQELQRTRNDLNKMVQSALKTERALEDVGFDTRNLATSTATLDAALSRTQRAYNAASDDAQRYARAVRDANDASAEAARRAALRPGGAPGAVAGLAAASSPQRGGELSALREDIRLRSEQARSIEVAAEAARRLAEAEAQQSAASERNNASLRQTVQTLEQRRQRQLALQDVFGRQLAAQEREQAVIAAGNGRRERLVRLLESERGQRIVAAEAARRQAAAEEQSAAAKGRLSNATRNAADAQSRYNQQGREALSIAQRVRGQVLSLVSAYVGLYGAINTTQKAIAAVSKDQSLQVGLRTVNGGDVKAAAADYKFLREEADRLGLVFDDLAPQYANIAASGRALGLGTATIRDIFSSTATAAAAMNLSVEDTEGVFRAMTQIFSKGKVAAEELRGQLGDRLPGAVVRFAAANNIALNELDKMLEKGTVGVDFVIKGIRSYANSYEAEMGNITNRLSAYINRAQNAYNDWLRTLLSGENQTAMKEAFSAIEDFFQGQSGQKFADLLGRALRAVVDIFKQLLDNIDPFIKGLESLGPLLSQVASFIKVLAQNADLVVLALKAWLALSFVQFANNSRIAIVGLGAQLLTLRTQMIAAGTATTAMGAAARGLTALFGPLGIAVAGVTSAFISYQRYVEQADARTADFIDTMQRARKAAGSVQLGSAIEDVDKQLKAVNEQVTDALQVRDALTGRRGFRGLTQTAKGLFGGGALTAAEAENDLTVAMEKQAALQQQKLNLQRKLNTAVKDEAEERRKALEGETFPTLATEDKTPKDKTPKGPDPESVQDRINNLIQDLNGKLAQTQIESSARTLEQIESNYNGRLAVIDAEVAKAQTRIEAIQRAAGASNKGKGTDISNELTTAQGALAAYQESAREQVKLQKATETVALYEQQIKDSVDSRAAKIALINQLQENGALTYGEAWRQTVETQEMSNVKIREQTQALLDFLATIDPQKDGDLYARLGVARLVEGLKQTQAEAAKTRSAVQQIGGVLAVDVAQGAARALGTLGAGLASAISEGDSLGDAFKNAGKAFQQFAADFLINIGQMIAQAIILQAIQNALNGTSGGYLSAAKGAFGVKHNGGIAGRRDNGNGTRRVSPLVFAGAPRFHSGGLPGLKSNEVATILERGEEVITANDPRHIGNGGGMGQAAAPNVEVVNLIDSVDVMTSALKRPEGRRQMINSIRQDQTAFRNALGIK